MRGMVYRLAALALCLGLGAGMTGVPSSSSGSAGPTTRPDDRAAELQRLVAELEDDNFEVRDRAEAALKEAGPDALPFLQQALLGDPTPELQIRAERLLNHIRLTWKISTEGGPVVGGFQLVLAAQAERYRAGQPIHLTLTVKHVWATAGRFHEIATCDVKAGAAEAGADESEARLVIRPRHADPLPRPEAIKMGQRGGSVDFVRYGSAAYVIQLDSALALPRGEYDVHLLYLARTRELLPGAVADLSSNAVRIRVD